jgi:FlaG/FlaF family flagellin (archaellin)
VSNYSVSRRAPATAASGSFTLGSLDFTASSGLTANGSATISLDNLLLGDISGAPINVSTTNATVTVINLLTLNLTVASDGSVQQVRNVTASVDATTLGPQTGSGTSLVLNFNNTVETPTPVLTADMKSHLVCSGGLNLTTEVTNQTIHLKAGDVVLNAADASPRINIFDATTIGLAFGSAGTGEEDVNGDGTVNVFDLIHVGRNYGAVTGACV